METSSTVLILFHDTTYRTIENIAAYFTVLYL